jgi:cell shape-determining protein MreD
VYLWIPTSALLFVTIASAITTDDEVLGLAAVLGALFAVRVWRILGRT